MIKSVSIIFLQTAHHNFFNRAGFTRSGVFVQKQMWGPLIYECLPPDCLYPTRTVVIVDIVCFFGGPLFVGAPVCPNMLNMPKSASVLQIYN